MTQTDLNKIREWADSSPGPQLVRNLCDEYESAIQIMYEAKAIILRSDIDIREHARRMCLVLDRVLEATWQNIPPKNS